MLPSKISEKQTAPSLPYSHEYRAKNNAHTYDIQP